MRFPPFRCEAPCGCSETALHKAAASNRVRAMVGVAFGKTGRLSVVVAWPHHLFLAVGAVRHAASLRSFRS